MHTIEIKITDKKRENFLIELLSNFSFVSEIKFSGKTIKSKKTSGPSKSTAKPSIDDFAGIWEKNPKTLDVIREKAWKRV